MDPNNNSMIPPQEDVESTSKMGRIQFMIHPNSIATPEQINRLIAREMNHLSIQERERVLNEVHAIVEPIYENPELIETRLTAMDGHLQQLKSDTMYAVAEKQNPEYVRDPEFRTLFLRAEYFDAKDAAERMIRFFEFKHALFGSEKLVQDITLQDFTEDDLAALRSGYCQLSPYTDTAGRPIVVFLHKYRSYRLPENVLRACYYVIISAMESNAAKLNGIIGVYYAVDAHIATSIGSELRNSLPIRFGSTHLCVSDVNEYVKTIVAICRLKTQARVRNRLHLGTHNECLKEISSFGIPRAAIPLTDDGGLILGPHQEWLRKRRQQEKAYKSIPPSQVEVSIKKEAHTHTENTPGETSSIKKTKTKQQSSKPEFTPGPHDVLFGRGKTVVGHPGNARLRQLIELHKDRYQQANRTEKTLIAEIIVSTIKDSKGRFLKRRGDNSAEWEEVDDPTARSKVAHAFRNYLATPSQLERAKKTKTHT